MTTFQWPGAILLTCSFLTAKIHAATYDLAADWSDTVNPNGAWSYNQGATPLPHQIAWQGLAGDFTSAQPAWARGPVGNTNLPCWFKSSGTVAIVHDWQPGDVVTHTTDPANGVGSGAANVVWTSPGQGTITISGAVWMGRDIGRGNQWTLSHGATEISTGAIASGDSYSRTNPFRFASGSGGAAVLTNLPVAVGDKIKLELDRTSSAGDYSGVTLAIDFAATADIRIIDIQKIGLDLHLSYTSQPGLRYAVQHEAGINSSTWATLAGTTNLATAAVSQVVISNAISSPSQFYRVWQLP